jgi:hypothetical protein
MCSARGMAAKVGLKMPLPQGVQHIYALACG